MTTLIPYKTMPVWDKNTIPAAVTNQHNTQAGTWGKLRVLAGRLKFRELTEDGATTAEHILTPESGVWTIYPQQWHRVEMLDDDTQMQLEFHCEPADYFHKKYGMTRTHSAVVAANETVPPGKALDLGCGQGRNALYLALAGHEVTASDYNPGAAEGGELGRSLFGEDFGRHGSLQHFGGEVPQFFMFRAEQDQQADGVGIERRGAVSQRVADDGGDFFGRQGQVTVERIHGTARFGVLHNGLVVHWVSLADDGCLKRCRLLWRSAAPNPLLSVISLPPAF